MNNLWKGRQQQGLTDLGKAFNDSIAFDYTMYEEDIQGSIAHAEMLGHTGIITKEESITIVSCLKAIKSDINSKVLPINFELEDIHTFIELELTHRIGDIGKKLHTARSRNDQSALDLRLYLRKKTKEVQHNIALLISTLIGVSNEHISTIMPGFTHLQAAQPTTLAHHLLSYVAMLQRDYIRFGQAYDVINVSPLGACAFAGTTFPINRELTAKTLNFDTVSVNSMDAISSRDHVVQLANCASILMMHLSRFCEDIILWNNQNFNFITLSDQFSTGSSIMPQKKNPDIAELIRGKTGRVYGNQTAIITMVKGLPQSYNKDMQEDKEPIFDTIKTVIDSLKLLAPMIQTAIFNPQAMLQSAKKGFINATDVSDYLVNKGLTFRDAYKIVGEMVSDCIKTNKTLEDLSLNEYKGFCNSFEEDIYEVINLTNCVERRISKGSPSSSSVKEQINFYIAFLKTIDYT